MSRPVTPVILCTDPGGGLWPLSQTGMSDALIPLFDGQSLFQRLALRCHAQASFSAPAVVVPAPHIETVTTQLSMIGVEPALIIVEPAHRDTAPILGVSALALFDRDENTTLLVMPGNAQIDHPTALADAAETLWPFVDEGMIAAFVGPDDAQACFSGRGPQLAPGLYAATPAPTANHPARDIGLFMLRADALLALLANHAPDVAGAVRRSMDAAGRRGRILYPEPKSYAQALDCAFNRLSTLSPGLILAETPMDAHRIWDWPSFYHAAQHDHDGTVSLGEIMSEGSRNCLFFSDGVRLVAPDLDNVIVIATQAGVLVSPRKAATDLSQTPAKQ